MMPSIFAMIMRRRPIVPMAWVMFNGHIHLAKIESHMHAGTSLSPVRLGCCNQDKDHEAASNDHSTFHFHSPFY